MVTAVPASSATDPAAIQPASVLGVAAENATTALPAPVAGAPVTIAHRPNPRHLGACPAAVRSRQPVTRRPIPLPTQLHQPRYPTHSASPAGRTGTANPVNTHNTPTVTPSMANATVLRDAVTGRTLFTNSVSDQLS